MNSHSPIQAASCADVQALGAEAGLGVLNGLERARVLDHLERCGDCAGMVREMARVSDLLLELVPQIEPPRGFGAQVLAQARLLGRPPEHRRWRLSKRWVALGAALAGLAGLAGLGVSVGAPRQPIESAALAHDGTRVGQVFVYSGHPSWIFMTVDLGGGSGRITCELSTKAGKSVVLGSFTPSAGYGSWGTTIGIPPASIKGVRLVTPTGATVASVAV